MKVNEYSLYRDVLGWHLETECKKPYLKSDKNGSTLTVDSTVWNSLETMEKHANLMHAEFKNLWKWVKKTHPTPNDEKSLKHSLLNLLFLLKYSLTRELEKWKKELQKNNGYFYNLPATKPDWQ